jgi:extracellular elastinolytic metalloproteinase
VSLPELTTGENSVTYARGDRFSENPTVTRVIVPLRGGRMRVGYLVETWDVQNQLWHTVVSGGGRVVHEAPLTASENYRVYYPHPGAGPAVIYEGPGTGYVLSQAGWVFTNTTTGNNVDAYLDVSAPNGADGAGSRPVADASGHFLATADLTQQPGTAANRAAAVTNLFYMNNFAHDWLYAFGFNEASGNFQENNFGLGGLGSDSVNAEAQDYSGFNNANFATPLDGSNPRMQMYLWTFPNPDRDGDLDADIIFHEYGHGLTNRMVGVGTMSGKLSGAIGEGMSDVLAVYLTLDDRIGEYSFGSSAGIRRNPYFDYTRTYGNVTGGSVHADGEIYAAAMSRLLLLWTGTGRDYIHLWLYMIDGLNYTPPFPAYEDMRDGILASMISFGVATAQDRCVVWDAFASYGIGHSANGTITPFSVSQAFDRAPECAGIPSTIPGSLTQASLKKLPRARFTADIQRVLRYRGSPAATLATTVITDAARRRATVSRGAH